MQLRAIGTVRSELRDRHTAPKQGHEGAPSAWLEMADDVADALRDVAVGDRLVVVTWFHQADRDAQVVHPRRDRRQVARGVFSTRSPDRPNPLGLHEVTVTAVEGTRLRVDPMEAVDGTPVVDLKPVLQAPGDRCTPTEGQAPRTTAGRSSDPVTAKPS